MLISVQMTAEQLALINDALQVLSVHITSLPADECPKEWMGEGFEEELDNLIECTDIHNLTNCYDVPETIKSWVM